MNQLATAWLLAAVFGCGPDRSVEIPEQPAPPPQTGPVSTSAPAPGED